MTGVLSMKLTTVIIHDEACKSKNQPLHLLPNQPLSVYPEDIYIFFVEDRG
jgi:hypothetical protein